jgi:hypothetical protein
MVVLTGPRSRFAGNDFEIGCGVDRVTVDNHSKIEMRSMRIPVDLDH